MKHFCAVCHKIHEGKCKRIGTLQRDPRAEKFRGSTIWKQKRKAVLRRDLNCCRICAERGLINNRSLSVHHIISLSDEWELRLDDDNLITLCIEHHNAAEAGRIPKEQLRRLAATPLSPSELLVRRG